MHTRTSPADDYYILGGRDLEMLTIGALLTAVGKPFVGPAERWGATASDVAPVIERALAEGRHPVLVEIDARTEAEHVLAGRCTVIDHHGDRAEMPSSLEQVVTRLGLSWDSPQLPEDWRLIVANDVGALDGMLMEASATPERMRRIRERDRQAQGISEAEEIEGARAAVLATNPVARLTVAELHTHDRTATVTDTLHAALGGPGYDQLLVCSPNEANYFGAGKVIAALDARYAPQQVTWRGGALPRRGYWGTSPCPPDVREVTTELVLRLGNVTRAG